MVLLIFFYGINLVRDNGVSAKDKENHKVQLSLIKVFTFTSLQMYKHSSNM
jgi:hypothetical protein